MKDDIKQLHSILNKEYYNLKKRFNINKKKRIKSNAKDIEDIYHDCLLKVLEKAEIDDFQFINEEKTMNYIKKTMFIRQKELNKLKEQQNEQTEETQEEVDLLLYVSEQYDSNTIQTSIFNKLFSS